MKVIGRIEGEAQQLTVMVTGAPTAFVEQGESEYLYIARRTAHGSSMERQTVAIGMSQIDALIKLLAVASASYRGKRKEFRVAS
jgi:hypothetical protein